MTSSIDLEMVLARLDTLLGPWDGFPSTEVGARDGRFTGHDLFWRAVGYHHAALKSSAGAEIAQPIGLAKSIFVVLNHKQGVAQITEFSQCGEEAVVVALMQTNGWFVEHVHDAG